MPPSSPMEILYRDDYFVAVNKPSGMLVHRSAIDRTAQIYALQSVRDMTGRRVYPLHRVDKPTSGILMFALTADAARRMMPRFAGGQVQKRYVAIVRGYAPEQGLIDYALHEPLDDMTDVLARRAKPAQRAVTAYRRQATAELPIAVGRYATARYSLISAWPRTGRKHQIRRHMKHIFHPIVGDTTYGDGRHNQFFRDHLGGPGLLLAAVGLEFEHPYTGVKVVLQAPLAAPWTLLSEQLGWRAAVSAMMATGA